MKRVLHVAGARPNFMKIAPVMSALRAYPQVSQTLIHTGQHYDEALSKVFFDELELPRPDEDLGVGSGSHAEQTAKVMLAFEGVCLRREPDAVVVVGDVNSTVACSLVAAKLGITLAHVEAGLRSFDWSMPEEINRVVTDRLSDLLFTTERSANENLLAEGTPAQRIHFVGNVMIDTLLAHRRRAAAGAALERFGLAARRYALVTLHRPSNVDSPQSLAPILEGLARVAAEMPVLFPAHPRTRQRLETFGLQDRLGGIRVIDPLGYLDFLALMAEAAIVLTDSGGIQEETTVLGVPCLTLRPNTERPVTLTEGTNQLVALEADAIVDAASQAARERNGVRPPERVPELWDGSAATRIAQIIAEA
ncbi:MAG: UDP-N-acetylglucosamine 2-epimerase (non-hydrolyzing) [Gemmatimonadota bacterium]|nr:MAG: UDP-N-acetylglucosamine 2-epimerase (non-hydrolyzing) [Gemmatimonadota bacterium]